MKKILIITALLVANQFAMAQSEQASSPEEFWLSEINKKLESIQSQMPADNENYKLYPTENIYTFLRLDTRTGKVDQVQWSLESNEEGVVSINTSDLSYSTNKGQRSFELYPTKNMYQFLLIDKLTGRMWHIQWGMTSTKRWIRRIYEW